MARRIPTNRFDNSELRILLQRKLRLPILAPSLQNQQCTCRSKQPIDTYGDHFFSCTAASKTPLHNYMRDTLYNVLATVGTLANLIRTSTDVILEPPSLLPGRPSLRPADIGLQLLTPPNYSRHDQPDPYLAIDVTITAVPKPAAIPPSLVSPDTFITQQIHDDSAKHKFNVPHAYQLHQNNILLLPFTIDHLGGFGPFATTFLYGQSHPSAATMPHWTDSTFKANPPAYELFLHSKNTIPRAILPRATQHWHQGTTSHPHFGSTRYTSTPEQWATQALALNTCKALTHHILTHLNRVKTHVHHQRHSQRRTHIHTPFYLPPPPFLHPTDTPIYHSQAPLLPNATTPRTDASSSLSTP
jgi:hypothetical protein